MMYSKLNACAFERSKRMHKKSQKAKELVFSVELDYVGYNIIIPDEMNKRVISCFKEIIAIIDEKNYSLPYIKELISKITYILESEDVSDPNITDSFKVKGETFLFQLELDYCSNMNYIHLFIQNNLLEQISEEYSIFATAFRENSEPHYYPDIWDLPDVGFFIELFKDISSVKRSQHSYE